MDMSGTPEIGSLTAHSNEDSQFVGSSSGVYFINTVKRAFSNANDGPGSPETEFPTAEDTLVGAEDSPRQKRRRTTTSRGDSSSSLPAGEPHSSWKYDPEVAVFLGSAPSLDLAKKFMMAYFKVWHSLFPFLHGPTFLRAMEGLYSTTAQDQSTEDISIDHRSTCWTVILQCVFNLGAVLHSDEVLPPESRIQSPGSMTSLLSSFSTRHDILSLQALLAVQVYLVATMSLRLASTFGGCVLRSMLHAGLHRCPFRYPQLSSHDRDLRKRIFWCAYAIDRYLSQALGLPLGIQDSDIDVCLPAVPEAHSPRRGKDQNTNPVTPKTPIAETNHGRGREENNNRGAGPYQPSQSTNTAGQASQTPDQYNRESTLASYVDSGTLTGRALELFHKSILVRTVPRSSVLFLVSDVHKWWNNLPIDLQGKRIGPGKEGASSDDNPFDFGPFFTVLYQHLILIIHRPSLSLDSSTAEFCSGLQTCIGAARAILAALKMQVDSQQALFWPGFLSAAWMSGLVVAFACQLKQYPLVKGLQEIDACSEFLRCMSPQWETAQHCRIALDLLSTKIKQMELDTDGAARSHAYALRGPGKESLHLKCSDQRRQKRQISSFSDPAENNDPIEASNSASAFDRLHPAMMATFENEDFQHTGHRRVQPSFQPLHPAGLNRENLLAETSPSLEICFQNTNTDYLAGPSNFDLNMGDLLDQTNFDSLFDIIGQQYPSF